MNTHMSTINLIGLNLLAIVCSAGSLPYAIVDSSQIRFYDNHVEIQYPSPGKPFFGQDAHYIGDAPAYRGNGDGKVSKQEFDGPAHAFPELDRDDDGFLTESEAPHRTRCARIKRYRSKPNPVDIY